MFGRVPQNEVPFQLASSSFPWRKPQHDDAVELLEEVESSADIAVEAQSFTARRSVRTAAFVAVFACAALAVGLLSTRGVNDSGGADVRGVVQLDSAVVREMHAARAKMQENINTVVKKMEPMRRKDRPERLNQMRQRFQQARNKLQKNTDALREGEVDKKLAKIAPAKAAVLRQARGSLQKGMRKMRARTASFPAGRAFAPQERRALEEARGKMSANVGKLTKKMDEFKRSDKPNRLHDMRKRLQSAQASLQMHVKNLAQKGEL